MPSGPPNSDSSSEDSTRIPWRWDDHAADGRKVVLEVEGKRFGFGPTEGGREFAIQAILSTGDPAWVRAVPSTTADAAAMAERGGRLYVALYRTAVTGCRVLALDVATGNEIWEVSLQAVGILHHSKYVNRVQITLLGDALVVFGDESGGRYVEVLDPRDGHLISHRVEKP